MNPIGTGMSTQTSVIATNGPSFANTVPATSQGDTQPGMVGVTFAAMIVQRPNQAETRNLGPTRSSSQIGSTMLPVLNFRR